MVPAHSRTQMSPQIKGWRVAEGKRTMQGYRDRETLGIIQKGFEFGYKG